MLIKLKDLKRIRSGELSLAYRCWKTPRVKKGSLIKTALGLVEILDISETEPSKISSTDYRRAGFEELSDLLELLKSCQGKVFKISLRFHSSDPRRALQAQTSLSKSELLKLQNKLARLDHFSKKGDWTHRVLKAIQENPRMRAADLAHSLSLDKDWLKIQIRKLKNLGLTISEPKGYRISPLGEFYLKQIP